MIAVVIVAILATVAGISYMRASQRSRMSAEINLVFASFKTKLDTYKADHGTYVTANPPADDATFWPSATPDDAADDWTTGLPSPHYWTQLGFNPGKSTIYCRYVAYAGDAASTSTTAWPAAASKAQETFGTANQPQEAWFYLRGQCDLDANGTLEEWRSRFDNAQVWMIE